MADFPGLVNFPASKDNAVTLIGASNNASATLAADVGAGELLIPVSDPDEFPASSIATITDAIEPWLAAPMKLELVAYTSKSGNNLVVPSGGRGAYGTTALDWLAGDFIELRPLAQTHLVVANAIIAMQAELQASLVSVVWGTPGIETSNAREVAASCLGFAGEPFLSGLADLKIVVSDGPADASPSHTATISPADTPIGTMLEGNGTASAIMRTNGSGQFAVKITEPGAGSRYLWISTGGHSRLWVRSSVGVLEIAFT